MQVYPQQLVTQDVGGALGEYAQFVCKMCQLVVRSPLVLPCAHMFCSKCFDQWVQEKRPNVQCPTCKQAVRQQEVKHFESRSSNVSGGPATGGALGLLYRLYSGMKVRCVYHSELLTTGKFLTKEAERASGSNLSCGWSGAMHDYTNHRIHCEVHAAVASTANSTPGAAGSSAGVSGGARQKAPGRQPQPQNCRGQAGPGLAQTVPPAQQMNSATAVEKAPIPKSGQANPPPNLPSPAHLPAQAPATSAVPSSAGVWSSPSWMQKTGAFQVLASWHSPEAGALCVKPGTCLWVTSTDDSGEWAYARMMVPSRPSAASMGPEDPHLHAWVPRAVLRRATYPSCSNFDSQGQVQGLSLRLGDFVHVYHREASGWTYGARLERSSTNGAGSPSSLNPEEVGWFPEACIADPVPVA